jgi:vacuolar protein sorting-associated protein IST1
MHLPTVELKMAGSRIQIASNKKTALMKVNMREIAVMLSEDPPKEEKAKIRAEALIRDDNLIEAYEILSLGCEMLHERLKLIENTKGCPKDLMSSIATIMWASQRVDIPELVMIRKQFRAKYGKGFEEAAFENIGGILNERVVMKLSYDPPAAYLVQTYLERICTQFEVDWAPTIKLSVDQMIEPMAPPVGYSVSVAQGTGLGPVNPYTQEATTGQPNTDEEIDYEKQNGGIPPALPEATATPYVPHQPSNGSGPSSNVPSGDFGGGDFEEVDIYIPQAPRAPTAPGASAPSPQTKSDEGKGDDDNDDDEQGGVAPGGGNSPPSATYDDLAARFDSLKK